MKAQTLKVPGATLYYETRGSGPVLLLIAGGAADAGAFKGVASVLAQDYTVVTYDPRGNSRSPLDGPAAVFGNSSGAIVGLDLIALHPTRVSRVVAHEPPMLEVLPDVARWRAFHDEVYDIYQREGAESAMQKWVVGVGLDVVIPPPSAELPPDVAATMKRIAGNWDFFFAHGLLPITRYVPDLPRLSCRTACLSSGSLAGRAFRHTGGGLPRWPRRLCSPASRIRREATRGPGMMAADLPGYRW